MRPSSKDAATAPGFLCEGVIERKGLRSVAPGRAALSAARLLHVRPQRRDDHVRVDSRHGDEQHLVQTPHTLALLPNPSSAMRMGGWAKARSKYKI